MHRHLLLTIYYIYFTVLGTRHCFCISPPQKVAIFQNKGGGHGSIGFHLCRNLKTRYPNWEVTIFQDKCNYQIEPFNQYNIIKDLGVKVIDISLSSKSNTLLQGEEKFDFFIDNWSKTRDDASFISNAINLNNQLGQIVFISSAGMYKQGNTFPITEENSIKSANSAREIELEYSKSGVLRTFIRPQYIYGEFSNKRYLDYFISRASEGKPIPIPLNGNQLVCLTHVEDVADLIISSLGASNAVNNTFNCGSDKYISYKDLCTLVFDHLNVPETDRKIIFYEPKHFPNWEKKTGASQFPFRRETFITSSSKAKKLLGSKMTHCFVDDIKLEIENYRLSHINDFLGDEELSCDYELLQLIQNQQK